MAGEVEQVEGGVVVAGRQWDRVLDVAAQGT